MENGSSNSNFSAARKRHAYLIKAILEWVDSGVVSKKDGSNVIADLNSLAHEAGLQVPFSDTHQNAVVLDRLVQTTIEELNGRFPNQVRNLKSVLKSKGLGG